MTHKASNRKQQGIKLKSISVWTNNRAASRVRAVADLKAAGESLKALTAKIELVKALAAADRGKFAAQVEAAKKALPSKTHVVMAGPRKRSATR